MKCFAQLLLLTLLVSISSAPVFVNAQDIEHTQIIVQTKPNMIVLPQDSIRVPMELVQFGDSALSDLSILLDVDTISIAFPEFSFEDTLRYSRTGELVHQSNFANVFVLIFDDSVNTAEIAEMLSELEFVDYAEMNQRAVPAEVNPDDVLFDEQWGLKNTGPPYGGTPDMDIDATDAWEYTTGDPSIRIGLVHGNAVMKNYHVDLMNRIYGDDPYQFGESQFIAGIMGADTDNAEGIAAVDWHSQIWNEEFDFDQGGYEATAQAVRDALDDNCDIINISWFHPSNLPFPYTERRAFADAYRANVFAAVAMGNTQIALAVPPAYYGIGITAVGAVDAYGDLWPASKVGDHIDVVAPGVDIVSTIGTSSYDLFGGTSYAAPHLAGVASLLLSENPNLYNDDLEQIIRQTAVDLYPPGWDQYTGTGLINASNALARLHPPYDFRQYQTSTGGTIYSESSTYYQAFYDVPGLADGTYLTKRLEVRKSVVFPEQFPNVPTVWGRGVATTGYAYTQGYIGQYANFAINHCEPVPGTITETGCTLRTWVYKVYDIQGHLIGWYPTDNNGVVFAYSGLGKYPTLSVTINGPTKITVPDHYTFSANPAGGDGNYSYEWEYRINDGDWTPYGGNSSQQVWVVYDNEKYKLTWRVTVTDGQPIAAQDTHICGVCTLSGPMYCNETL